MNTVVVAVDSSMGEYTVWTVPQYSPYDWNKPSSLSSPTAAISGAVSKKMCVLLSIFKGLVNFRMKVS